MKKKFLPCALLFLAAIICFNLWNKNRRLKRDFHVAEAQLNFPEIGNNAYDSVYAKGNTASFYKNGKLVGSGVRVE